MLSVLQIGKYFDPDEGGIETVTRAISEGLHAAGDRADVLCFSRRPSYPPAEWPWEVIRARTSLRVGDKPLSAGYVAALRRLAPRYDVGLLHVPNPIGAAAVLRWWRAPLVVLWHSDVLTMPRVARALRPLDRAILRRATAVWTPSRAHVAGSNMRALIEPKSHVIPFPFDPAWLPSGPAHSPMLERVRAFAAGRRIVLAIGRLVPYKGYDVLIDAARRLDPGLCVVIAGSGPDRAPLEVAAAATGGRVLMAGRVDNADLGALYERAALVAMPSISRQEMYGMTQVEAFSFGRPVVSTAIPFSGVPEVNTDGETGLVVPPGDAQALAAALDRLASDPVLYALLAAGARARFDREHRLEAFGDRCAGLFRQVVADAAARPQA